MPTVEYLSIVWQLTFSYRFCFRSDFQNSWADSESEVEEETVENCYFVFSLLRARSFREIFLGGSLTGIFVGGSLMGPLCWKFC